jgi:hypothetical protein
MDGLAMYSTLEVADPWVAPQRRALAIWGLTADDIGVLSIHELLAPDFFPLCKI